MLNTNKTVSSPSCKQLVKQLGPLKAIPILFIWPNPTCNCRCVMCDIWKIKSKPTISSEDIKAWVSELSNNEIRSIVLTGGEALLHPEIWKIVDSICAAGITVSLLSTGFLLEKHAQNIVQKCSAVYVSLDGPENTHNAIRNVPKGYEKLKNGVRALKDLDSAFPVKARCTVQKRNFRMLRATVDAAHDICVDRISFLAADVSTSSFNRENQWEASRQGEVMLSASEIPELETELKQLAESAVNEFSSGFIHESPALLKRKLLDYYSALALKTAFPINECNAPWTSAVVEHDGTVRPCFFQKAYGNINEAGGLLNVLNSEESIRFRDNLDVRSDPICQRCVCTMSIYGCNCEWTSTPPYCDETCSLVDEFLT